MNNYKVERIKANETYDWILNKHYAKRMPMICYAFGLYSGDNLVGVCTLGKPPSNALCVGICGQEYSSIVYELNRLCVNDNLPKNSLSFFVGQVFKLIDRPKIIVSYADTSQNHHGYIYQATNWIYTGLSAKRRERFDPNNPQKHSRTLQNINIKNLDLRERPQKHRYIQFIGSKSFKRLMNKKLNYKIEPYPKGNNKRYDSSYKPIVQSKLF